MTDRAALIGLLERMVDLSKGLLDYLERDLRMARARIGELERVLQQLRGMHDVALTARDAIAGGN